MEERKMPPLAATTSAADILKYQNQLVRTQDVEPLGRMQKIAIGPVAGYIPPPGDALIAKFGRIIELRDRVLPIAQSRDRSMIVVMAPMVLADGRVGLPDLPDPQWTPPAPTKEEIEGIEIIDEKTGRKIRKFPETSARQNVRMLPQRLEDRAESRLQGTNFLVFSPVLRITFQPEINKRMIGDAWLIECKYNNADRTHMTLLVDERTGETHFFGGAYEILGNAPK
jgi:hypothetical protein